MQLGRSSGFPHLLYLPSPIFNLELSIVPVALYEQTLLWGITAAGTAPDLHRIPLHRTVLRPSIASFAAQRYAFLFERNHFLAVFFASVSILWEK